MKWRGPLAAILMFTSLLLIGIMASADDSSLFTLNNERNVPITVFDIKNASSEQLSSPEYGIALNSSLIYLDVDRDGHPEVFYCSHDGKLYQYSTKDDTYIIVIEEEKAYYTHTPQVVDVDLDGSMEVLLYDPMAMVIQCFDLSSGKEEWNITNPTEDHGIFPQPKVLIDHDANESRVLVLLGPGTLVLLDGAGKELWSHDITLADVTSYRVPTMGVADLDLDGSLEVVVSSTKRQGDDPRYVELDVFSLNPPGWLRTVSVPGDEEKWNYASSPPLLADINQAAAGLEIVVGTIYGGLAAFSSADGSIIWHHPLDNDWNWKSLGTVRTENRTFITAYSSRGIYVLDPLTGDTIHFHQMGTTHIGDHPLVAYVEPNGHSQAFIFGAGRTIRATDPIGRGFIWHEMYERWMGSFKLLLITGRDGISTELHVFFSHSKYEGDENYENEVLHYRYWIPEAEDRSITVDPPSWTWYPNVSISTKGISIDAPPEEVHSVLVRLYQGRADDLMAVRLWPDNVRSMSFTYPHYLRMERSSIGTDGVDNDHIDITMELRASWYFAQFGNIHLHMTVQFTDGTARSVDVRDWLVCEPDLIMSGHLELVDGEGNVYREGEWVRAGVDTTVRGVTLTFPGGQHVPDPGDVELVLLVNGTTHLATFGPEGVISAELRLPAGQMVEYSMTLYIACRWTPFLANQTLTVHLDPDPPELLEYHPANGTWYGSKWVIVACLLTDGEGSGVGRVEVQFWLQGEEPGDWVEVTDMRQSPSGVETRHFHEFNEGTWQVRWRAVDSTGNGPVTGPVLTLYVDLSGVVYGDIEPEGWVAVSPVEVSLLVRDVGGSGVDLGSIEYSYSTAGIFNFTIWESAGLSGTADEVTVMLSIPFEEGTENIVVFRAMDAVGNSRSSSVFWVMVDLTPPMFHDPTPSSGETVYNTTVVECRIRVEDTFSGIDPNSIHFQYAVGDGFSEWENAHRLGHPDDTWLAEVVYNTDGPTAVRWRGMDMAGNGYGISEVYSILINRPPVVKELEPPSPVRVREDQVVTFTVSFEDTEGDEVSILWLVDSEEASHNDSFTYGFALGEHMVRLVLDDGQGNIVESVIEVTSEDEPVYEGSRVSIYIVVMLIVVVLAALAVRKSKDSSG